MRSNLTAAPLKPQKRLFILRRNLLPRLYHELILTPCPDKFINWLDRCTRGALRSWLQLLKDTPTAFFQAEVTDGGVGVLLLSQTVPLKRLGKQGLSEDLVIFIHSFIYLFT